MASNQTNRYTGELLAVSFGGTWFEADFKSFGVAESVATADTTAGTARDDSHILTIHSANFTYTGLQRIGSAGSAVRSAIRAGLSGTLIIAPEGTATGRPQYSCLASVIKKDTKYPFEEVVEETIEFKKNGGWIAHFEILGSTF